MCVGGVSPVFAAAAAQRRQRSASMDPPSFLISIALPPLALRHEKPVGPMVRRPCDCGGCGGEGWLCGGRVRRRSNLAGGDGKERPARSARARAAPRPVHRPHTLGAAEPLLLLLRSVAWDRDTSERCKGSSARESGCARASRRLTTPPRPPIEMLLKLCVPPSTAAMVAAARRCVGEPPRACVAERRNDEGAQDAAV